VVHLEILRSARIRSCFPMLDPPGGFLRFSSWSCARVRSSMRCPALVTRRRDAATLLARSCRVARGRFAIVRRRSPSYLLPRDHVATSVRSVDRPRGHPRHRGFV